MKKMLSLILALVMVLSLTACGGAADAPATPADKPAAVVTGVEDGVLTIAMECAYAPYNWTQSCLPLP